MNAAHVDMKFSKYLSVLQTYVVGFFCERSKCGCFFCAAGQEPGLFDAVIVNDNLEDAYEQLKSSLIEVSVCVGDLCPLNKWQ